MLHVLVTAFSGHMPDVIIFYSVNEKSYFVSACVLQRYICTYNQICRVTLDYGQAIRKCNKYMLMGVVAHTFVI